MKYFYFQMLKDKKIIIHKTDGKTFIPITGRSYRTNSSHGFLSPFQFLTFNPSCYFVVCKTRKTNHLWLYISTSLFAALQVKPARRLQEKSAARCPSLSRVGLGKAPSQTFKCVNTQTKKRPVLFHIICTLRWIFQNKKHILVAKTPFP